MVGRWLIFLVCFFLLFGFAGCNLPVSESSEPVSAPSPTIDPNYMAFLLSQTQTAQATPQILQSPSPTSVQLLSTETPVPISRCELFEDINITLFVLDFVPADPLLKIYLGMPDGVPGLSKGIAGDPMTWEYWALLGDKKSQNCGLLNFEDRLYCYFSMQDDYRNTTRSFELFVNACEPSIYRLDRLALIAAKPTQKADNNSCGNFPLTGCGQDYANWCACTGGTYICNNGWAGCAYP